MTHQNLGPATPGVQQVTRTGLFVLTRMLAVAAAAAAVTALPAPAYAPGIDGEAADLSTYGFVQLGTEHMLLGWEHLAFIAGVLLLAGSFKLSVKLISIFVLGHSRPHWRSVAAPPR